MPETPFPLGRKVEHDPRSLDHPFPVRTLTKQVDRLWANSAPILNQKKLGSCEGNTAAEWTNSGINANNRQAYWLKAGNTTAKTKYLAEADAVKLYSLATQLDEDGTKTQYPPDDTGTSALGVGKAMQALGIIKTYQWSFGWAHFTAAIDQGPVMLGTDWYEGMFDPDEQGYCNISGDVAGGHAYLARGIDYEHKRVLCRNHWTKTWNPVLKGEFYLSFATLEQLLGQQGDVLVPVKF